MRWDAQRLDVDDGSLPGMPSIRGLLRSVQVPEFPGLTLHEVRCRSALNAVPAPSAMPFPWTINPYRGCSHACVYCVGGDTAILMADGRQKRIAELRVGDRIIGTEKRGSYRFYVETEVLAHWSTIKPAHRVTLADGTELIASGDHRFLTGRGWKHVTGAGSGPQRRPHLTTNDELLGYGSTVETPKESSEYRRGYLTGMIRGDATLKTYRYLRSNGREGTVHRFRLALVDVDALLRTQDYLLREGIPTTRFAFAPAMERRQAMQAIRAQQAKVVADIHTLVSWPEAASHEWYRGFLAGIFDAEGSRSQHVLRITNAADDMLAWTMDALAAHDFDGVLEDRGLANHVRTVRVRGGLTEHLRFTHLVDPAIRR
jgi:hypothetical protein